MFVDEQSERGTEDEEVKQFIHEKPTYRLWQGAWELSLVRR